MRRHLPRSGSLCSLLASGLLVLACDGSTSSSQPAEPDASSDGEVAPDASGSPADADASTPDDGAADAADPSGDDALADGSDGATVPDVPVDAGDDAAEADGAASGDARDVADVPDADGPDADGPDADGADGGDAGPSDVDGGETGGDGSGDGPPIDESYGTFIGDWDMGPGEETTKCVTKRLDNPEEVWVTAMHTYLAKGSHHMIVYKSDAEEEQTEPFECTPFTETLSGDTFPLMITQISEETLELPDGVAVRFEPNQMIRMEAHYLNYYPEEITAHGEVTFDTIAEEDMEAEANMLFYGYPDFSLPPGEETQTDWQYLPVQEGTKVYALTGHTHQYGENVEIEKTTGADVPGEPVYPLDEEFLWDEAPVIEFDPPLSFGENDGFRYRCTWFNDGDETVGFGESANQEMCFFWAYYYPSQGYRMCINTGSYADMVGGQETICCPGSVLCGAVDDL